MKKTGQASSEFLIMMAILTLCGLYLLHALAGAGGNGGAIQAMKQTAAQNIAQD